jgi:hypothetical protein
MSDTFRDALRNTLGPAFLNETGTTWLYDKGHFVADVVLASDEMQAIRKALHLVFVMADNIDNSVMRPGDLNRHCILGIRDEYLPGSVIAWVLDDPSPDSPADKPCETCHGGGRTIEMPADADAFWVPCPSCRGGEPT